MLLFEKLNNYKLILASNSPRRRHLIKECGLIYDIADGYEVEELYPETLAAESVPVFLSVLKSEAYPKPLAENEILITADTVVIVDNEIIGKPKDHDEAVVILKKLSGRSHTVITGVTLRFKDSKESFDARSEVFFRDLSNEEINFYIDIYKPYDKAGAYGIQEWIGYIGIEKIEGSFYNVMGLPIQKLYTTLDKLLN